MRLYFCLVHPLLRASGKDKTMKRIPKTPIEFDYDLWTTEDGKCMVRVKLTGEVTEVDREVMQILRTEEKRLRRSYGSDNTSEDEDEEEKTSDSVLSLDALPDDDVMSSAWLADDFDMEDMVLTSIMENGFLSQLSSYQQEVYCCCMKQGMTCKEFAAQHGNSPQGVHQTIKVIRGQARKYFKKF